MTPLGEAWVWTWVGRCFHEHHWVPPLLSSVLHSELADQRHPLEVELKRCSVAASGCLSIFEFHQCRCQCLTRTGVMDIVVRKDMVAVLYRAITRLLFGPGCDLATRESLDEDPRAEAQVVVDPTMNVQAK
eukprot:2282359-Amphidinium_carterae.1